MGRKPNISRDVLLDAAEAVVLEAGAARLTLDAVSAKAGVSKGGLLYSFPTKEVLLEGMVRRLCDRFEAAQSAMKSKRATPADGLKAYVVATFAEDETTRGVEAAVLAAAANDLRLLKPVHEHQRRDLDELVQSSGNPERAAVIWLATIGIWLLELLKASPLGPDMRQKVLEELLKLADEIGDGRTASRQSQAAAPRTRRPAAPGAA